MLEVGQEWRLYTSPFRLKETTTPTDAEVPANTIGFYAKDKAGVSALYLKDDAGSEREIGPANAVTGTGAANKVAYWTGTSVLSSDTDFHWDATNNRLGIGTAAPAFTLHLADPSSLIAGVLVDSITSASAPSFIGRGARNTLASPSAVQANDTLALLGGRGYGATAYSSAVKAALSLRASENWTDSAQGTYFSLFTTATGGTTLAERVRIASNGLVGIGVVPTHLLHLKYTGAGTRAFGAEGDGTAANASFETYVASTAASTFIFRKGRGTVASPGQTLSGDSLMTFVSRAVDDGPALTGDMAKFEVKATENITSTGHGSRVVWTVVPNGSTTQAESVLFPEDGGIALADGITAPATLAGWAKIYVDTADGNLKVKFGDGFVATIAVDA